MIEANIDRFNVRNAHTHPNSLNVLYLDWKTSKVKTKAGGSSGGS